MALRKILRRVRGNLVFDATQPRYVIRIRYYRMIHQLEDCKPLQRTRRGFVCSDGEARLTFSSNYFAGVICLDAFHYINSKAALAAEMMRVTHPEGVIMLPHVHNARAANPTAGKPCTAGGYRRCFEGFNPRLFSETALAPGLCRDGAVDFRYPAHDSESEGVNAFALIASRRGGCLEPSQCP
jgi:hypothetical protein